MGCWPPAWAAWRATRRAAHQGGAADGSSEGLLWVRCTRTGRLVGSHAACPTFPASLAAAWYRACIWR